MALPFLIDEIVVDDSFISYCFQKDPADIAFWEAYLLTYPQEAVTLQEAKEIVTGLTKMLHYEQYQLAAVNEHSSNNLYVPEYANNSISELSFSYTKRQIRYIRKKIWLEIAIAATLVISLLLINEPEKHTIVADVSAIQPPNTYQYSTAPKEKKTIYLPDSTKVVLNGDSYLSVDADFGKDKRVVFLSGEGFFDVKKNKRLPFLVKMKQYYVRVLGTTFNVRDYPDDARSETSLISGKVEIFMEKDSTSLLLKTLQPNQKFILYKKDTMLTGTTKQSPGIVSEIGSVSYTADNNIAETGWIKNRLYIEDETFAELQHKLERWYGIKLIFGDEEVKQYRFTATFENEPVETVMKALQMSYPFNYTIKANEIIVSKSE